MASSITYHFDDDVDDNVDQLRLSRVICQTAVPDSVVTFIRDCTMSFGKAKLVLKHNKHYIESPFPEVLRELLKNATVSVDTLVAAFVPSSLHPCFLYVCSYSVSLTPIVHN